MSSRGGTAIISSRGPLSTSEVISILLEHGCTDVSLELDPHSISEYPINAGGFGDIYSGWTTHGRKIAIKCARHQLQGDRDSQNLKLIAREIHAWSKCNHENILELLGLAQYRGKLAIVSPWMENGILPDYIARHPRVDRLDLSLQVTKGLVYLHKSNMVHGDLKGANILVSSTGVLKLTDFGNTKLKEQTLQFSTATTPVCSLRWAAPEVLRGSPCSQPADVYALGMTIYEIVTGTVPYADKSDVVVMVEVLNNGRFPTRNDDAIQISSDKTELWKIMTKCWDHNSARRPRVMGVEAQLGSMKLVRWKRVHIYKDCKWDIVPEGLPELAYAKIVIVGDESCRVSPICRALCTGKLPAMLFSRLVEYHVSTDVGGNRLGIHLVDNSDVDDCDSLRALAYSGSDLILICFAIDSLNLLSNIKDKWIPEVRHFCGDSPIVLVGADISNSDNEDLGERSEYSLTYRQGSNIAKDVGALCYLECSGWSGKGISELRDFLSSICRRLLSNDARRFEDISGDTSNCVVS